MIKCS